MKKPYLISVGIGFSAFGIYGHWYIDSWRKYKLRKFKLFGIIIVITTYKKV